MLKIEEAAFALIIALLIFAIAYIIYRKKYVGTLPGKIFIWALAFKLLGALSFGMVYDFYYGDGDTFYYFRSGKVIQKAIINDTDNGIKLLLSKNLKENDFDTYQYKKKLTYWDTEGFTMSKICAVVGAVSMNSYVVASFWFACFAFLGQWLFFLVFYRRYPERGLWIAIAILFVPSVIFWGSGVLKDTVSLGALGCLVYIFDKGFFGKRYQLFYLALAIPLTYFVFLLKAYVVLALVPALFVWVYMTYMNRSTSKTAKMIVRPIFFVVVLVMVNLMLTRADAMLGNYSVDNLERLAKGFQSWHTTRGGSSYDLGEIDFSPTGIAKTFPKAINVTFFRPYLWESGNPVMLASALESLAFLGFFLFVLLRAGPLFFFKQILRNPDVAFCTVYALILGFAVGFTSYNFGALVRYKIPCLAFFLLALVIIYSESRKKRLKPKVTGLV